jgi:hypothetical protein
MKSDSGRPHDLKVVVSGTGCQSRCFSLRAITYCFGNTFSDFRNRHCRKEKVERMRIHRLDKLGALNGGRGTQWPR